MVTPAAHREAVAHLRTAYEMSERRACCIIGCDRASVRYQARRPDDAPLRERLRALAHERRRFVFAICVVALVIGLLVRSSELKALATVQLLPFCNVKLAPQAFARGRVTV